MKIDQLKMLKTVAEQGTLKAASERLFKTQAAVSKGIKQLESQLGIQLFNRDGYRMILTAEGEQIFQLALTLLDKAVEIENLSHHLSAGNEASVTLAVSGAFDMNLLLPVLGMVQEKFPDTQIILRQEQVTGAMEALNNGEADLAIAIVIDELTIQKTLDIARICQGAIVNVASPMLLSRHPNLRFQRELEKEYQIIVQDTGNQSKSVSFGVQDGQRCWYVNDLATKKMLTLSGMGWGMLPEHLIVDELADGTLVKIALTDGNNNNVFNYFAARQKSTLPGPVARLLWDGLKGVGEELE
ncbi:LysR family transcriptional regulator [Gammaproteobacteria bacterium 45_16_T64]|nr:LysR family transcriptional regulator [Gammaproteobacteria bacterium 45_16_T64]